MFLAGSAVATGGLALRGQAARPNPSGKKRLPIQEFSLEAKKNHADPFWDVEVDVLVTAPDSGERRIPAFWSGGKGWRWRFASSTPGKYQFRTIANHTADTGLHGVKGNFEVAAYQGDNALFAHGAPRVSKNKRHLETADGVPFFWLGDTWWLGLTKRLSWPEDFQQLAADRREKGFNVIQLVAGLYPDMDSFDPRGANEAGFPWETNYDRMRPEWWDQADQRIEHLVESGLMPCVVGCWGYYLSKMGMKKMKAHWRYLIARWGAWPVVWCLAGEGSMPWYLSKRRNEEKAELEESWTELARYVRETDPFHRLITIHPSRSSREVVRDASVVDFDMLQTGHSDYRSIPGTLTQVAAAVNKEPVMPVLESEVCYEGIMESCRQDIQRFMFWSTILNGCCGFTYGANGIWQVNREGDPFGASPSGRTWGDTLWKEAMRLPGGRQVGIGARLLRSLPWQDMEPHPEWVEPHWNKKQYHHPSAAGIPGKLRVIYTPTLWDPPRLKHLEKGVTYQARLMNPGNGEVTPLKPIKGNEKGEYKLSIFPQQRDWVIILERAVK